MAPRPMPPDQEEGHTGSHEANASRRNDKRYTGDPRHRLGRNEEEGPPVELPVEITAIRTQKRRADRFSLFHQETFLIGVSGNTVAKLGIRKGIDLTLPLFNRIRRNEEREQVRDYLLRLLGRRHHAAAELDRKARQKGYEAAVIADVIAELREKQYLDDEAFARQFAADKLEFRQWGPVKVRAALIEKGVGAEVAGRVTERLTGDLELEKICVDLALKRTRHFLRERDDYRRRQKVAAYLQRKGFDFETVNRALPEILSRMKMS